MDVQKLSDLIQEAWRGRKWLRIVLKRDRISSGVQAVRALATTFAIQIKGMDEEGLDLLSRGDFQETSKEAHHVVIAFGEAFGRATFLGCLPEFLEDAALVNPPLLAAA